MKILIINGTNHRSTTNKIANILASKLAGEDNIKEFFLPHDCGHFCLGCYACLEDESKCPYYKDKKVIMDAMEEADLFIFTTPNYCLAPAAPLKAFFELMFDVWMVHRPKEWMFKKKAVAIATSAGAPNGGVLKAVKHSLSGWGISYIKTYGIPVAANSWEQVSDKKKEKINKDMSSLAKKLSNNKPPRVSLKIRFMFNAMGFMHKKGLDSSPCEKVYWEERGWLQDKRPWNRK